MKFNGYLKKLREERRMTKAGLARSLGITTQYLVDVEAGRGKPPTLERCEQISKVLRLSEEEHNHLLKLASFERLSGRSWHYVEKLVETAKSGVKVKEAPPEEFGHYLKKALQKKKEKPPGDSKSALVKIPLLRNPSAAGLKPAVRQAENEFEIPWDWARGRKLFFLRISDNSMSHLGLHAGDLILVEQDREPIRQDLVVVESKNTWKAERFSFSHASQFLGIVRGTFHKSFFR